MSQHIKFIYKLNFQYLYTKFIVIWIMLEIQTILPKILQTADVVNDYW